MNLAIIKYNAGNTQSVTFCLNRLGIEPIISDDLETLQKADKLLFPGVGEASTAMQYLRAKGLDVFIKNTRQPLLGICLGMQLLCRHSEEGDTDGIGIFDVAVRRFSGVEKVPQMGWNTLHDLKTDLFKGVEEASYQYFVHSYYAELCADTIATTTYGFPYSAALHRDNFWAVQFHPEKSAGVGEGILRNFLAM